MDANPSTLLLVFPEQDSDYAIARSTLRQLGEKLGVSEVDVVQLALRMFNDGVSVYAPDDGPLSDEQLAVLRAHAGSIASPSRVVSRKTLF